MANLFRMRVNIDYLRFILKRNRRFIILMSSAMILVFPVLYLTTLAINPDSNQESLRYFGQVLDLILLITSAIILPIILFAYMNKKKDLDVYHALPIRQSDLFITTTLSSLILLSIPFMIAWISGSLISLDNDYTWLMMLENGISSLFTAYAISAIVTLALVHVGTSVDGLLYAALLNVLPVLAYLSYNLFRGIIFLGFNMDASLRIIGMIFPIWSLFENLFEASDRLFEVNILNGVYWLIWTMILFNVSRVVYIKRKHEKAESAFTNNYFFPIISSFFMVLLIFIMYSTFYSISNDLNQNYYAPANFIFPFFFAAIVYLVMDTISQRSFKHLFKALLKYLIIALASFSLLFLGLLTRNFTYVTRIPELEDVESIQFEILDYQRYFLNTDFIYNDYSQDFDSIHISDEAGIQTILDLHQIILDEYAWIDYSTNDQYKYNPQMLIEAIEANDAYQASYEAYPYSLDHLYSEISISFTYELKSGQKISRQYNIPYQWTKVLYGLYDSPAILKYIAPNLAYVDTYSTVKRASLREYTNDELVIIDNLDLNLLKEAYEKDMSTWTKETYITLQGPTKAILNLKTANKLKTIESDIVLSDLTPNTNAYLESLVDFPQASTNVNIALIDTYHFEDQMLFHRPTTSSYWYYPDVANTIVRFVHLNAELYQKILPYTTQYGLSDEPLLALVVKEASHTSIELDDMGYSNTMLIKKEYESIVLDLIKDLEVKESTDFYSFSYDVEVKQ